MNQKAYQIINCLNENHYQAYLVGGCVRDGLLGIEAHDIDIASDATPEQVLALFNQTRASGMDYGTITIIIEDQSFEVTTFRKDYDYTQSRRPTAVSFSKSIEQDLARRDFTMNAMAYHPISGLVDPYHGAEDLRNAILRCVGDPLIRFQEDALRILRGYRFACQLHLTIEEETHQAMEKSLPSIHGLSSERIVEELRKLLVCEASVSDYHRCTPLFIELFPEFKKSIQFDQANPHHRYTLDEHVYHSMQIARQVQDDIMKQYQSFQSYRIDNSDLRLVLLLHDIAKPLTQCFDEKGIAHYLHHDQQSSEIAKSYLKQLKYPKKRSERIVELIKQHQRTFSLNPNKFRKTVSQLGVEWVVQILIVKLVDNLTHQLPNTRITEVQQALLMLDELLKQAPAISCLNKKDMILNGHDIMRILNIEASLQVKEILEKMHTAILNNEVENKKTDLQVWLEKQI